MKIFLGPAGSPAKSTLEGISFVKKAGLHAMEVAFTHGVRMSSETAKQIGAENEANGLVLSIHAPYYINLASADAKKVEESKQRILSSCERAHRMGAKKVVFHAAYYGVLDREEVYEKVREEVKSMLETVKNSAWDVSILPETMGRESQFGSLDELVRLHKDTGAAPCVDPAHIYARNIGKIDFSEMFNKLEKTGQKQLHFHFSAINYGPKGERNHLVLGKGGPSFEEFSRELLGRKFREATIISESPVTWKDSLVMKGVLEKMGYSFDKD